MLGLPFPKATCPEFIRHRGRAVLLQKPGSKPSTRKPPLHPVTAAFALPKLFPDPPKPKLSIKIQSMPCLLEWWGGRGFGEVTPEPTKRPPFPFTVPRRFVNPGRFGG